MLVLTREMISKSLFFDQNRIMETPLTLSRIGRYSGSVIIEHIVPHTVSEFQLGPYDACTFQKCSGSNEGCKLI